MIIHEPVISVGLLTGVESVSFKLCDDFVTPDGAFYHPGIYTLRWDPARKICVVSKADNGFEATISELRLTPLRSTGSFILHDVVIGIEFHWERKLDQEFNGALKIRPGENDKLIVINEVPLETYLIGVISSEMSSLSHPELLKAHTIISRGWLLAQLESAGKIIEYDNSGHNSNSSKGRELIKWYDRENHTEFDICADDHCQRYQGITKPITKEAFDAVHGTFGQALISYDELVDARFSKSCGGVTECYSAAWEDKTLAYLETTYDGSDFPKEFALPLNDEANAVKWISNSPPAFCNTNDRNILEKILVDFDQETSDFYRWKVVITQSELQELLKNKIGFEGGRILILEPIERGPSGRLIKLKIVAENDSIIIGKELVIRRALSPSHLYSSAFIVENVGKDFILTGAGWGHGVGLCQIGAAVMAEQGFDHRQILSHYYHHSLLQTLYSKK